MRSANLLRGMVLATCLGAVLGLPPIAKAQNSWGTVPRHAFFSLHPGESRIWVSLSNGSAESKLTGWIQLFLGDPSVPVIAIVGMRGVSVDDVTLVGHDFTPDGVVAEPLVMVLDRSVRSIGAWNTLTGQIDFDLHLRSPSDSTTSGLPFPAHWQLSGTLTNSGLELGGGNPSDRAVPEVLVQIKAFEADMPPPPVDVWFSTEIGFGAGQLSPPANAIVQVSDGDLLSRRGHIVRKNHELTARLGFMPVVPDLGLDAVTLGPRGQIWFSFEEQNLPMWSEGLRRLITGGDLLSEAGYVVRSNAELLAKFVRMPPVNDAGLDAVARGPNRDILFSTEQGFFSQSLGRQVRHGDLLSERGRVVMTNQQLLRNFRPIDPTMGPLPRDWGLDVAILRANKEIWFSTEFGFQDERLGPISDGDLLSTNGHVVVRNLALLNAFGPVEDVNNFGLDAATLVVPSLVGDFDFDGDVDRDDLACFQTVVSGPAVSSDDPDWGDLDGDGDADMSDFGLLQQCISGAGNPANADCGD